MRIQTNLAAETAQRNGVKNSTRSEKSLKRLSSGYKINSFADDAAGGAISEKMRVMIRGLDQANRNIQDAISLVDTGDGSMQNIHDIMGRMRELAVQSASDTNDDLDREAIQLEFDSLISEIDSTAHSTDFNTIKLLDNAWNLIMSNQTNMVSSPFSSINNQTTTKTTYEYFRTDGSDGKTKPTVTTPPTPVVVGPNETITQTTNASASNVKWSLNRDPLQFEETKNLNVVDTTTKVTTTTTTLVEDVTADSRELTNDVSNVGYPQFTTTLGSSAIPLYCAMTKLSVMVDGKLYDTIYSSAYATSHTSTATTATTTFLVDGIEITQTVNLASSNGTDTDSYSISLSAVNTSGVDKDFSIKFAFDALNGYQSYSTDGGSTFSTTSNNNQQVWDPANGNEVLKFQDAADGSQRVSINIIQDSGGVPASKVVLDNIETLYYGWDYNSSQTGSSSTHAAAGLYWENINLAANGGSTKMGVTYGEAEFFVDAFKTTVTNEVITEIDGTISSYSESNIYEPDKLTIQTGAYANDFLEIPLLDLTAKMLNIEGLSVLTRADAQNALEVLDSATSFTSAMRGIWGSYQNLMDKIYDTNGLSSENTQNAMSRIKDADMALEISNKIKSDVLSQSSRSMLAQANAIPQQVLQLLS